MATLRRVKRSRTLPADPVRVWRLVTEPGRSWLGSTTVDLTAPGSCGVLIEPDGAVRRIDVEVVEDGRRLVLRWARADEASDEPTRVEVTLVEEPGGTRVTVTETVLADVAVTAR
jgi:uncharacterized protein YndB with AHSA1/START domain